MTAATRSIPHAFPAIWAGNQKKRSLPGCVERCSGISITKTGSSPSKMDLIGASDWELFPKNQDYGFRKKTFVVESGRAKPPKGDHTCRRNRQPALADDPRGQQAAHSGV